MHACDAIAPLLRPTRTHPSRNFVSVSSTVRETCEDDFQGKARMGVSGQSRFLWSPQRQHMPVAFCPSLAKSPPVSLSVEVETKVLVGQLWRCQTWICDNVAHFSMPQEVPVRLILFASCLTLLCASFQADVSEKPELRSQFCQQNEEWRK